MASGKPFCLSGLFFQLGPGVADLGGATPCAWANDSPEQDGLSQGSWCPHGLPSLPDECGLAPGVFVQRHKGLGTRFGAGHILLPKKHHEGRSDLNIRDINSTYKRERLKKSYCKRQRYRQGNNRYYFFFFTNNLMKNIKQTKRSQARNQTKTKI